MVIFTCVHSSSNERLKKNSKKNYIPSRKTRLIESVPLPPKPCTMTAHVVPELIARGLTETGVAFMLWPDL